MLGKHLIACSLTSTFICVTADVHTAVVVILYPVCQLANLSIVLFCDDNLRLVEEEVNLSVFRYELRLYDRFRRRFGSGSRCRFGLGLGFRLGLRFRFRLWLRFGWRWRKYLLLETKLVSLAIRKTRRIGCRT